MLEEMALTAPGDDAIDLFKALADERRITILAALRRYLVDEGYTCSHGQMA